MPELPEVEVVRRGLESVFQQMPKINRIVFLRKDLRDPMPIKALEKLTGADVIKVDRRAKYLIIQTSKGGILSHLGMTGSWRVVKAKPPHKKIPHDHVEIYLSDGRVLIYNDPRRFGIFETIDLTAVDKNPRLKALGVEPFDSAFDAEYLKRKLKGKSNPIKVAIMDQAVVVGVGNIYASEVLFEIGVPPNKVASRLSHIQYENLVSQIRKTLQDSIDKGGSSISDFFNTSGEKGSYQKSHKVYGRANEVCVNNCGGLIKSKVFAGRSTFWCPRCQR